MIIDDCRRLVRETGLAMSDQVDFLRDTQRREANVASATGIHWSGRGNELLARALAADVAALHPAIGLRPANFNGNASEEPTIGEPTTTTLLTLCGYWMATERLTVPPMLCPTRGAL